MVDNWVPSRQSTRETKELFMIPSNVPAKSSQKRDMVADCGAQGPMSQQDAVGSHGHEMHPQKFVRLVGCHDSDPGKHQVTGHLH
jgi:hypothetical protein